MKYEKIKCIYCGKVFERAIGITNHGKSKGLKNRSRGKNCVTCSPKCSRKYNVLRQNKVKGK